MTEAYSLPSQIAKMELFVKIGSISMNEIQQTYHIKFPLLTPKAAQTWFLGWGVSETTDINVFHFWQPLWFY